MLARLTGAYRAAGADLPFSDPARWHGVAMEGCYWRIEDAAAGRSLAVLCGACVTGERRWSLAALAAHPDGVTVSTARDGAVSHPQGFGIGAGELVDGSLTHLRAQFGDGDWIDVRIEPRVQWPARALGGLALAHLLPGLPQYWHPALLDGAVSGEACLAGEHVVLDGARCYAEKNWGPGFPRKWWWGHAFCGEGASAGFAGGRVGLAAPSVVFVQFPGGVVRLVPPLAVVRMQAGRGEWRLRARGPRWAISLEGDAHGAPHILPVPHPGTGEVYDRSRHHLDGRMRVSLRSGRRLVWRGDSSLAALEIGEATQLAADGSAVRAAASGAAAAP